jgi:hypothetical protein
MIDEVRNEMNSYSEVWCSTDISDGDGDMQFFVSAGHHPLIAAKHKRPNLWVAISAMQVQPSERVSSSSTPSWMCDVTVH